MIKISEIAAAARIATSAYALDPHGHAADTVENDGSRVVTADVDEIEEGGIDDSKFVEFMVDNGNSNMYLLWFTFIPYLLQQLVGNHAQAISEKLLVSVSATIATSNALATTFSTASRFSKGSDGGVVVRVPALPLCGVGTVFSAAGFIGENLHMSKGEFVNLILGTSWGKQILSDQPLSFDIKPSKLPKRMNFAGKTTEQFSKGLYEEADYEEIFGYVKNITLMMPHMPVPRQWGSFQELLTASAESTAAQTELFNMFIQRLNGGLVLMTAAITAEEYEDFSHGMNVDETGFSYLASKMSYVVSTNYSAKGKSEPDIGRIAPFAKVRDRSNKSLAVVRPKVNEKGLSISDTGVIFWLPEKFDQIDEYEEEVARENTSDTTGEWCALDVTDPRGHALKEIVDDKGVRRHVSKRAGANRLIYLDLPAGKLAYTNRSKEIKVLDLDAWVPARPTQIEKLMRERLSSEKADSRGRQITNLCEGMISPMTPALPEGWLVGEKLTAYSDAVGKGDFLAVVHLGIEAVEHLNDHGRPLGYIPRMELNVDAVQAAHNIAKDNVVLDWGSVATLPPFAGARAILEGLWEKAQSDFDGLLAKSDPRGALTAIGFARATLDVAANLPAHVAAVRAEKDKFDATVVDANRQGGDGIPNIGKGQSLLPHQTRAWAQIKAGAPATILDAQAGAGKTMLGLGACAYYMAKFGVMKPIIACPAHLVKNYFEDGAKFFQGKMNFIALTNATMASWGEDKLRELVQNAPRNTIFLTDFFFLKGRTKLVGYGDREIEVSANAEFVREIGCDMCVLDEVHFLKNAGSGMYKQTIKTFAGVKYLIEMSGTYMPDDYLDVLSLFRFVDPAVFGTRDDFLDAFQEKDEDTGRVRWKPNAGQLIKLAMQSSAKYVNIKRREWRASLPPLEETFHYEDIEMTPNQKRLYDQILNQALDAYKADLKSKKNGRLNRAIEENNLTEAEERAAAKLMNRHFARLQRFISAPENDEAGKEMLTAPEDRLSPKTKKLYQVIRDHIKARTIGKIIVFCQYHASVESIIANAPPDIKAMLVHYEATRKDECLSAFLQDDKMVMVGVENSMNTGLNLQHASRLIRYEVGWGWGQLEQGMARIWRPVVGAGGKIVDPRKKVYVDWLITNKSVDVTRVGRLMAKTLDVIKFQEHEDSRYQDLKPLPRPSLSPATIRIACEFDRGAADGGLRDHLEQYGTMLRLDDETFLEYRNNPANNLKPLILEEGLMLEGSMFLKNVPYVPNGTVSYHASELGLVKYLDFVKNEEEEAEENDDGESDDVEDAFNPQGLSIHTDQGDGLCVRSSGTTLTIELEDGTRYTVKKTAAFVITRAELASTSIREAIAKRAGADVASPIVVPAPPDKSAKKRKGEAAPAVEKPTVQQSDAAFEVFAVAYNEWATLEVFLDDPDVPHAELRKQYGFIETPDQLYTQLKRPDQLEKWLAKADVKFRIPGAYRASIQEVLDKWEKSRATLHLMRMVNPAAIKQFLLGNRKPLQPGEIRPHILFTGEKVFLAFDLPRHNSVRGKIKSINVPGLNWKEFPGALTKFCKNTAEAKTALRSLCDQYTISNKRDVLADIAKMNTLGAKGK